MTSATVVRFDRMTRAVHWSTAILGGVALVTGTILYVPELSAPIGQRALLRELHVVASLLLAAPLVVGVVAGRAGRGLRRDLIELSRWTPADRRWLRRRTRGTPVGKFNGGQKLVTAAFAGLFVMQLLSGSVMFWHDPFRDSWRTGATFVHDWAYLGLAVAVLGHVIRAAGEPELMSAMARGTVPEAWAATNRPTWKSSSPSASRDDGPH
jgi:formate dehydrogenase subunit gamma